MQHERLFAFAADGITVHVITNTGAETYKGAFADGTPVTDDQLAYVKGLIDHTADAFVRDVSKGGGGRRALTLDQARKLADGRVHSPGDAKTLGLIDDVMSFDEAIAMVRSDVRTNRRTSSAASTMAALSILEKNQH
jgi:ClpP class serine protease